MRTAPETFLLKPYPMQLLTNHRTRRRNAPCRIFMSLLIWYYEIVSASVSAGFLSIDIHSINAKAVLTSAFVTRDQSSIVAKLHGLILSNFKMPKTLTCLLSYNNLGFHLVKANLVLDYPGVIFLPRFQANPDSPFKNNYPSSNTLARFESGHSRY